MKKKKIQIVYFNLIDKKFISSIIIDNIYLDFFKKFADIKVIQVEKREEIEKAFKNKINQDYDFIYVDGSSFLLESFLLRAKFECTIPIILILHTVWGWKDKIPYILPLLRSDDVILAPSKYAKECFFKITNKFKVNIFKNFLDILSIKKRSKRYSQSEKKFIIFLGRIIEEKGLNQLVDCMPEIISKSKNAYLNIVGPLSGDNYSDFPKSKYVMQLENKIKNFNLTERVLMAGLKTGDEKYKILSESNIFVNSTIAKGEVLPTANIEALACGLPLIATNWGGNKETVISGINGYLIDVHSSNGQTKINRGELIEKIITLLNNKRLNNKLRKGSLKSAAKYDYRLKLNSFINILSRNKIRSEVLKWNDIKKMKLVDFKHLFNKKYLFFLYFDINYRKKKYSDLFNEAIFFKKPNIKKINIDSSIVPIKLKIKNKHFEFVTMAN